MIRLAQSRDHQQLKALWMQVFGDSAEAVDAYFALRHRDEDMLVWAVDGEIGGMLSMLPLALRCAEQEYPARYIYAVATAPALRGRGIATTLLKHAEELALLRGDVAAALVPASRRLFGYYEKRGYHTAFSLNVADYQASELPPDSFKGEVVPCDAEEYLRVRDCAFSSCGLYARWDEQALAYALSASVGAARLILAGGGEGIAAWSRTEGGILIHELGLCGMEVPSALALLHRHLGAASYRVRLPAETLPNEKSVPFGMLHWLIPQPETAAAGYLALALD